MIYTVYVLLSKENCNYVGFTNNMPRRLLEHNSGKSYYTRRGSKWEVVYTEKTGDRIEARKREKYLKSHAGKEWLKRRGIL